MPNKKKDITRKDITRDEHFKDMNELEEKLAAGKKYVNK